MTPTCTRLKFRLDERRRWFSNEWFFKWHFIGKDRPVTINSFDGRDIHLGGIEFSGTARDVFWDTLVRGVRKEITDQFAWIDEEVRKYNSETAVRAIDECAGQLISFVRVIRREAVAKDRILRGNGISFPSANDAGRWDGTSDRDIVSQADALKRALPPTTVMPNRTPEDATKWKWWERNRVWHEPLGWVVGIGSVLVGAAMYWFS